MKKLIELNCLNSTSGYQNSWEKQYENSSIRENHCQSFSEGNSPARSLRKRQEFSSKAVLNERYKQKQKLHFGRFRTHVRKNETQIGTITFHFQLVLSRVNDKL